MRKLFITIGIVSLVALAASAAAQIAPGPATPDQIERALNESPGPWADEAIELVVSQGLYIGYPDGSFGWRNNISRAEFAVVLARLIATYGLDRFSPEELDVLRNASDELQGELSGILVPLERHHHGFEGGLRGAQLLDLLLLAVEASEDAAEFALQLVRGVPQHI